MNIHLIFDLTAAAASLGVTFFLSRGVLAPNLSRIESIGWIYYIGLAGGAIWGAFAFGTLNLWASGEPGFGRSILGALIGAILMVELSKLFMGERKSTGALFVPAFTVSTMIGRWGCFFAGLDDKTVGIHTTHPFGVDFGDGLRHPVQLYESGTMALTLVLWLALIRLNPAGFRKYGFYLMCIIYGSQRFIWEFLKPYGTLIGPFNTFHILCVILIGYGICMIIFARKRP